MNASLLALVVSLILAVQSPNVPPDLKTQGLLLAQTVLTYIADHPDSAPITPPAISADVTPPPARSPSQRRYTLMPCGDGSSYQLYADGTRGECYTDSDPAYVSGHTRASCDGLTAETWAKCVDSADDNCKYGIDSGYQPC
jgi:hypothetical protein